MTVTFIDPPNSVVGKTEALDFTASSEVIAISVGFGAVRDEERVYRDGAFLRSYTRSSKVGNTYSIVRDGGWPANPQLYVDETPPAPSTFWSVLYDKDLRTLPNQTVSATMVDSYINFTADGQPWCFHGSSGSLMIVNGQGMVATVNGDSQGGNGYAGLFVALKAYQMTGWDPAQETAVQVRLKGDIYNATAIGGAQTWGNRSEGWGYGPGDECALVRLDALNGQTRWADRPGAAGGNIIYPGGAAEDYNTLVLAIAQKPIDTTAAGMRSGKKNYRAGFLRRQCDPNVWPSMESMPPVGAGYARTDITLDYIKMGFYAGSVSGNKPITATHIRVLQRPVV